MIDRAVAALWLRGAPRPADVPVTRCRQVVALLRSAVRISPVEALYEAGFWMESMLLQDQNLTRWVEEIIGRDGCLTVVDARYPFGWLGNLGDGAPPAVWCKGGLSGLSDPAWLGVAGSRRPSPEAARWLREAIVVACELGYGIVSGGAAGCDSIAAQAAGKVGGPMVEVLPYGIRRARTSLAVQISCLPPDQQFSTAGAMERNALIYAFGSTTLVVQPRYREGGTWHGAVAALRKRRNVLVMQEETTACRALMALGAKAVRSPLDLAEMLQNQPVGRALFSLG